MHFVSEVTRCVSITELEDREDGNALFVISTHLGLGAIHRIKASEILNDLASRLLDEKPSTKIIIQGDFNSFSDWEGPKQLAILDEGGILTRSSRNLLLFDGTPINTSFISFPYDFGKSEKKLSERANSLMTLPVDERRKEINNIFETECDALGSQLDQVLFAGFKEGQSYLVPAPLFSNTPSSYTEDQVKKYIVDHINDGPAFASDHQPVISIFK